MTKPKLTAFEIPEEDRELFMALDLSRRRVGDLSEILDEYRSSEKTLAARVFSKFGIPPGQTISFQNWVVHAVGGKVLPPAPKRKEKPSKGQRKRLKKKKKETSRDEE